MPLSTLRLTPRGVNRKTQGQDGVRSLLSCRALSSPTTCRFSPAHVAVGTILTNRPPHRSVRAELPHTALPLDRGVEEIGALRSTRVTQVPRSESDPC